MKKVKNEDNTDKFAPGQFAELSDSEKLSAPAFEKMQSGFSGKKSKNFQFCLKLPRDATKKYYEIAKRQNCAIEYLMSRVLEKVLKPTTITAEFDADDSSVIIHPSGKLKLRQNILPLEIELDKFSDTMPEGCYMICKFNKKFYLSKLITVKKSKQKRNA
jgi:hypothetical protein